VHAIAERRDRILERYLPALNPIVEPALGPDGRLAFRNAAVEAGVAPAPSGYRAAWFRFDNATGDTAPLGETSGPSSPIAAPPLPPDGFVKVQLSATGAPVATWERPIDAYFRRTSDGWTLVGLERLP
jgi:hypothetical protein